MNYIITYQYARGEETCMAGFGASHDAATFLNKKMTIDQLQHKKKIYRLYSETDLLREFNPEKISVTHAKYADGDGCPTDGAMFLFQVSLQTQGSLERKYIACFNDSDDATLFITEKCETDSNVTESDLFCLFKGRILIKSLNKVMIANQKIKSDGSKAQQSTATFHPTPMPTRPTPPGGPSDCWIEKDEDT